MTTVLFSFSHFITKLPPDTTILSTFPARNNCSTGCLEYIGMCFSMTHFSLCIVQKSCWGRTCPKVCLLPQSLFLSDFIAWSCHDKLANLHPCCDSLEHNPCKTTRFELFPLPPVPAFSCRNTARPQALDLSANRDKLQDLAATCELNKATLHLPDLIVSPQQGLAGLGKLGGR